MLEVFDQTLASIAERPPVFPAGTPCAVIDGVFHEFPACSSVIIASEPDAALLVNREAFFQAMTGRLGYGRTLYYRRPVADVIQEPALVLDGHMTVDEAARTALDVAAGSRDDLLVRVADGWGSVPVALLHRRLADLHDSRAGEIERTHGRFRSLVENAVDVILVLDADGRLVYQSRHVEGLPPAHLGDHAFTQLLPEDVGDVAVALKRLLLQPKLVAEGDFRMAALDGKIRTFEYRARNLLDDAAVGGIIVNFRDVTEQRRLEAQLRHHALHDELTGLANRQCFFDRVSYTIDRMKRVPGEISILYCDLDGFKQVNDGLGHSLGDEVLREAARRLSGVLRRGDTLARVGGDEFVVLASDCPRPNATLLAQRLIASMREPIEVDGRSIELTVSVGHVTAHGEEDASTLVKRADLAMYAAKMSGRNRATEFTASSDDAELRRRRLTGDLRLAVARGELALAFQPIFDVQRGGMVGAEALLRWSHPVFGGVSPAEVIPLAEQNGLIRRLGRWVLNEACRAMAGWIATGRGPQWVSVNLSAEELDDPDLVQEVAASLHLHGLRPHHLHLELTESAVAVGVVGRLERLVELRDIGVSVALDDFGTGYSSLSSAGQLPIDVLKIDRSFVLDLRRSPDAVVVLRGIVDLAHSLGFRVVAEGVEQPSELRVLESIGCDFVQGYLLGRPVPADAVLQHLPVGS